MKGQERKQPRIASENQDEGNLAGAVAQLPQRKGGSPFPFFVEETFASFPVGRCYLQAGILSGHRRE